MTIKTFRKFIKQYKELLLHRKIIVPCNSYQFKPITIIDICGFIHKKISVLIINNQYTVLQLTYQMKQLIESFINNQNRKQTDRLIFVFDPLQQNELFKNFKQICQIRQIYSNTTVKTTNIKFDYKEVAKIKRCLIYNILETFKDIPNVEFIVSSVEADIMIGALCHQYQGNEIQVISYDCDMSVHSYPNQWQDDQYIYNTVELFKLFGFTTKEKISQIPEFIGCDYNNKSKIFESIIELQDIQPSNTLIYKVYNSPQEIEEKGQIPEYNWLEELQKITNKGRAEIMEFNDDDLSE